MTIRRLLQESSFDQDEVGRMVQAYEAALTLLHLKDREDPVTEVVAGKIIQIYKTGEHDPPRLCARAVKELGIPLPK
jgi:hypothetical protein